MAQFDVYINPSRNTRTVFPYIVDIQNSVISDIATRIVIPLGKLDSFKNEKMKGLTPEVEYAGEKFILLTRLMVLMAIWGFPLIKPLTVYLPPKIRWLTSQATRCTY